MYQFTSPEGVLTPSPVTLVGAWVFGAAADFFVVVCARTNTAVSTTTIAITAKYLVILASSSRPKNLYHRGHRGHGVVHFYSRAITSISTSTSLGRRANLTVERYGGAVMKYLPDSWLKDVKSFLSFLKT